MHIIYNFWSVKLFKKETLVGGEGGWVPKKKVD